MYQFALDFEIKNVVLCKYYFSCTMCIISWLNPVKRYKQLLINVFQKKIPKMVNPSVKTMILGMFHTPKFMHRNLWVHTKYHTRVYKAIIFRH